LRPPAQLGYGGIAGLPGGVGLEKSGRLRVREAEIPLGDIASKAHPSFALHLKFERSRDRRPAQHKGRVPSHAGGGTAKPTPLLEVLRRLPLDVIRQPPVTACSLSFGHALAPSLN